MLRWDASGGPGLRIETADGGRLLVRQGARPLLFGRVDPHNYGVSLFRCPGYVSPLPPVRAAVMRRKPDWAHVFRTRLAAAGNGPLHAGRWLLDEAGPPPYCWRGDLVTDWPAAHLDWFDGWHGIVPLRPLGGQDEGRVKAYRKHARDGTLAPVLLWWVSGLDGHLLLDGHDRAVAALAEGADPPCLVLALGPDAAVPRERGRTRAWPVAGGPAVWEAARAAAGISPGTFRAAVATPR
ncbi:hypothetical protein [Streptomyces johnsoniae]|uniref:Uncharacterized protein n=1 Tax=Streptomyces johnsoniae TaxID=3075532 RepID=A0ABU2SA54_9ACTN|nr:hypothetical protein [Streptomyces sp. DSM 41886]MDT0445798.1 hypothetical protein [Streptomyces sp. DSM 41886]